MMKVVFVCSGNYGITALVKAQADSLRSAGLDVLIYPIIGKGLLGYLKNIRTLRQYLKEHKPDLVHAHYSFSGFVASLSTRLPVLVSLMGSDVHQSVFIRPLIRFCSRYLWKQTIVKSENMKVRLGLKHVQVIPNGVNLELFKPLDKSDCRKKLSWDQYEKHILFVSACDPNRPEKNLSLAEETVRSCPRLDIKLHVISEVGQAEMPVYVNASDLLLLTSKWEGSPNTVKEAMACNVPVVSTRVGDVEHLFRHTSGYLLADHDANSLKDSILAVLEQETQANGRDRIFELGLGSNQVASGLISLYQASLRSGA